MKGGGVQGGGGCRGRDAGRKKGCREEEGVQGGGGRPCQLGGSLPIWPPAAGWLSGESLTQMFAQHPGQALAGSQTSQ